MREKRFRAWDKDTGSMIYNPLGVPELYPLETLMEFIGVIDAWSFSVFEGDIVMHKMPDTPHHKGATFVGVIEYVDEVAAFRTVTIDGREEPIHSDVTLHILGNIYDNPELLGDKSIN